MREKLKDYLTDLVNIPSVTGNERDIADYVENFLKKLFPEENIIRYNNSIIAFDSINPDKKTISFIGHLDTVPGENEFTGKIIDNRLYGLGASDMKGGLAVMMALAEYFKDRDKRFNCIYVFYEREEGPYDENGLEPLLRNFSIIQRSDLAVVLEPTNNNIQVGCLGTMHASVIFKGKRAHSARPWQGENAIHRSADFLKRLSELKWKEYTFGGLKFVEVMNATMVDYSGGRNIIPDRFVINVNYRFAPGKSIEEAKKDVLDLVKGEAEVQFTDLCPSGKVCLDNPVLQELINRFSLKVEAKQAWTDVARLSLYGVDAVNFGPGDPAQAHQKNEYIPLKNLYENFDILRDFLEG
ncbi:MAG TPA: succinyl-diaminopimelate desuccinylase [Persephonella sp.]|uniref:Succinyl-diaminopimelate desuccinylase n=1 Tax=Persephonella marina (strain DSM 14350 / EX-H1) TaxID=123214 RepID=C0QTQ6_PERMH|nr:MULTISPECIES: succinyl-diaminopimelate desuccinylase [Persephonella]ACO03163.1 succinyl-diaminopimelate desuccinylase [Persephonella marina EX-H1]HCB70312.1 succinyl-diaminopimelate desuccinylase [Persephonella sp.]